jgi:CRISPR-associated protein Cmr6
MQLLSRREDLQAVPFDEDKMTNASLWLDKFIKGQNYGKVKENEEVFKQTLLEESMQISVPDIYKNSENGFFVSWRKMLEKMGAKFKILKLDGRMNVGLGGESVLETSITLHRIYGVPFIPGSALKGLAAAYAHKNCGEKWRKETKKTKLGEYHRLVFGAQDFAGFVNFYDALLIPEADKLHLHNEVMTVHHSDYYGGKNAPPADWDSPVPISFLSASGKYLVALQAPEGLENLTKQTFEILKLAMREEGIGAKISSGYGRGHFEETAEERADREKSQAAEREKSDVERFLMELCGLRSVPGEINKLVEKWRNSTLSDESRKQMAEAIINRVDKDWQGGKQKEWYQELTNFISSK